MFDVISNKTLEEGSKTTLKLVISIVSKTIKKAVDHRKAKEALHNYIANYISRHGHVKILGMTEPIPLSDVYVSIQLVPSHYLNRDQEIQALETSFRKEGRRFYYSMERKSAIAIANEKVRLNVLGPPGSGKSTLLKRIGMMALLRDVSGAVFIEDVVYEHECIPVLIELRRLRNEPIDLKQLIQREFENAGFPESNYFVESALKDGNLLILLDGIDEVPYDRLDDVIIHLKDFTDRFKKNRFITSCRTAFYKNFLSNFSDIEVAPFDHSQIRGFIQNWFRSAKDIQSNASERFITQLFSTENKPTLELTTTPLLLTFLCITFDDSQKFPANRSFLYKRAFEILLDKWAAEKRIHNEDIYKDLPSDLEIEMLAEVARGFFEQNKIFFYKDELKQLIKTFLEATLNVKAIPLGKIIDAIEVQQGLLVQRAPDIYSFSHLTFQEYLTAHFFKTPRKTQYLIDNYLHDPKWREVFLLLAGLSNSDDLLVLMTNKLVDFGNNDRVIRETMQWISSFTIATGDFEKDACKRIFIASLLLRYKRYDSEPFKSKARLEQSAINLSNAINPTFLRSSRLKDNISKKDAHSILDAISLWERKDLNAYGEYKHQILEVKPERPMSEMLHGSRHHYRQDILRPLFQALKVPSSLEGLRRDEYSRLVSYLDSFTLIIECKTASLKTSRTVWDFVCQNILVSEKVQLIEQ